MNKDKKKIELPPHLKELVKKMEAQQKGYSVETLEFDDIFPNK